MIKSVKRSNDTRESQKENKTCFNAQYSQNYGTKVTYTSQYCDCENEEVF